MKENTFKSFMKKWIFWYILIYTIEAVAIISGYLYATPKGERKEEVNKALNYIKDFYKRVYEKIKAFFVQIIRRILK